MVFYIFQTGNLGQQMKPPLQTGSVADHKKNISLAGTDIIPGNFFFFRAGIERISTRKINQQKFLSAVLVSALSQGYSFSGPVSSVLMHFCKSIKNTAFSYIGIAC